MGLGCYNLSLILATLGCVKVHVFELIVEWDHIDFHSHVVSMILLQSMVYLFGHIKVGAQNNELFMKIVIFEL